MMRPSTLSPTIATSHNCIFTARSRALYLGLVTGFLSFLSAPTVRAQGTLTDSRDAYARGKPLSEWVLQSTNYIPENRRDAVKAIAIIGPAARAAVPALIRATRDENIEVRYWALEALARIGPDARESIPALLQSLAEDVRPNQLAARRALETVAPGSVPLLLPALRSRDAWVRANVAEAIGTIRSDAGKSVPALATLLADDSLWVRASAAWALGRLGPDAKGSVKQLGHALQAEVRLDPGFSSPGERVRVEQLVFALGRLGSPAKAFVPEMIDVLNDGDDSLRAIAADALAGVGRDAVPALAVAVRSSTPAVRAESARALRLLGPDAEKAVPALIKVLETTDELEGGRESMIAVADALGGMGKKAKKSLPALTRHLKSGSGDVLVAVRRAIRKIKEG
ncbi:MAG: HEAT repeat domain-containing protein [Gemmatimonadota bacterium]